MNNSRSISVGLAEQYQLGQTQESCADSYVKQCFSPDAHFALYTSFCFIHMSIHLVLYATKVRIVHHSQTLFCLLHASTN
jgi:hypothetical protein